MARVKSIIEEFALSDKTGLITATHEPHPIFTELEELCVCEKTEDLEWKETARYWGNQQTISLIIQNSIFLEC